jgi:DtxR family Mn-dependent transcriptional regulator
VVHPDDLSPVAQDYLKVIWSRTEWGGAPITTGELAQRFGTSAANATETVKRLAAQGLLEHVPYKPVRLTPDGTRCAIAMVRRHRLIETFLVRDLGYGWDEVHDEAERLEHAVTDRFVERIDVLLGRPTSDPHGDPIPDAGHRTTYPQGVLPLADVEVTGRYRVVRVSDESPAVLGRARARGLVPDVEVRLVPGQEDDADLARAVLVVRADGDDGS